MAENKQPPKVIRREQPRKIKDLATLSQYELADLVKKSKAWFDTEAKKLAATVVIKGSYTMKPEIGQLYTYRYDAKHKDILPFWDRQPIVFPFTMLPDGFIGLNFHYIHPKERMVLLHALETVATSTRTDVSTKLKLSYQIIQTVAKNKKFEKCIHRYLYTQMKTPFKKIHSKNWISAILLPNDMFIGATAKEIWSMK